MLDIKFRKLKKSDIEKIRLFYKANGLDNAGSLSDDFLLKCLNSELIFSVLYR
ncbi:MAG TPA: hypothetical protein P5080_03910 [Candidatus Paceibacterota bacterium]|nr:hypothetical protein [Candidatus Paceibacterota bacterium]HSA36821.1 hypothetical protein [Candidatus Paceibacterota bacterium]